jgi:cell division protein FtsL
MAIAGLFILIGLRAYGATIQHENNELIRDNQYLQAEIDSLKSQIIEETKVTRIEKVATSEYGMVYPTSDNCVRIKSDKEDRENLAALIRSEAYN